MGTLLLSFLGAVVTSTIGALVYDLIKSVFNHKIPNRKKKPFFKKQFGSNNLRTKQNHRKRKVENLIIEVSFWSLSFKYSKYSEST